jgi:hypothetical protein
MKTRLTVIATAAAAAMSLACPVAHAAPRPQFRAQPQAPAQAPAQGLRQYRFIDDHPTGGPGPTSNTPIFFTEGDPRYKIEPSGLCGQPFIGGTVNDHADPRLTDPSAVCGHGYVYIIGIAEQPSRPLSIQPITEPIDPDAPTSSAAGNPGGGDPRRVIREQLPQLDRPEGDRAPVVRALREAVHATDVAKAVKFTPKRLSK